MADIGIATVVLAACPIESEQPMRVWRHGHRAKYPGGLAPLRV